MPAEVENCGSGGEVAATTLGRLKAELATRWPQLVIWQVGANDPLTGVPIAELGAKIEQGRPAKPAAGDQIVRADAQSRWAG